MSSYVTELQKSWDGIREYLGKCPLYEGVMLEKDNMEPQAKPVRFMQHMNQKHYKCKFCDVMRDGTHRDYCVASSLKKPKRQVNDFVGNAFR